MGFEVNRSYNPKIPRFLSYNIGGGRIITADYARREQGAQTSVYLGNFSYADELTGEKIVVKIPRGIASQPGMRDSEYVYNLVKNMSGRGNPVFYKVIDTPIGKGLVEGFIEGEPLDKIASSLSLNTSAAIVAEALVPLQELHQLGGVHRDVKPANIMVTPEKRVVLGDYGYAIKLADTTTEVNVHAALGTPNYQPPEAFSESARIGVQTDIYAMGITLWQLLTRKRHVDVLPGDFSYEKFTHFISTQEHDDLMQNELKNAQIPGALQDIIMRAINRQVAPSEGDFGRYLSAAEMRSDLVKFLGVEPREVLQTL